MKFSIPAAGAFVCALGLLYGQVTPQAQVDANGLVIESADKVPQDYYCPMDKNYRSDKAGKCPICGMELIVGVPDQTEYPLRIQIRPPKFKAGEKVRVELQAKDPVSGKTVDKFEIMHDRRFHLFFISNDMQFFVHEHPMLAKDGTLRYDIAFPKPGMYRVLGDFYPTGGVPQLVAETIFVPGSAEDIPSFEPAMLKEDVEPQKGPNTTMEMELSPVHPIVGEKTLLEFKLKPGDGLEKYLNAWAHMMAASDDLVDTLHEHPFAADGGDTMYFNVIFPRARTYRVWLQFQRKGVLNTVAFNIPVTELK
jgi:hypothetical protein